jgi:hypothetical protein
VGGFTPGMNLTWGDIPPPHQLDFLTLSGILRHLEAELSILRCLKLIRGLFPLLKKYFFFSPPLIFFYRKSCQLFTIVAKIAKKIQRRFNTYGSLKSPVISGSDVVLKDSEEHLSNIKKIF